MTELYDVLIDTARFAGITYSGITTSTPSDDILESLVDTSRHEPDDYYNNGTLFIRSGENKRKTRRITKYTNASGIIMFAPQVSDAIVPGVYYSATNANREHLVQAINQALLQMGPYTEIYEELQVGPNQNEYDLPSHVRNLRRIMVSHGSGNNINYTTNLTWQEINGKLIFLSPETSTGGDKIRIYYNTDHSEVNADDDLINDNYDRQRLAWTATYMYLLNRMQYSGNEDERETILLQNAQSRMDALNNLRPVRTLNRDPILGRW